MGYKWLLKVRAAFVASFLKKILLINRSVVDTSYGRFYVDPVSNFGNAIVSEHAYEEEVIESLEGILKPGVHFWIWGQMRGSFLSLVQK